MAESGIEIRGAEKFGQLARALKDAGDKDLRRELYRGIQRATKPMKLAVRAEALRTMPARGGLNTRIARAKITTKTRGAGRDVGVRIVAKNLRDVDRGKVRHPVFGNRKVWVSQSVPPGVVSGTLADRADDVRREIDRAVDQVTAELERKIG